MKKYPETHTLQQGRYALPQQEQRAYFPPPPELPSFVTIPDMRGLAHRRLSRLLTITLITALTLGSKKGFAQSCASTTGYTRGSSFSTAALGGSLFNWTNPGLASSTTDGGVASASFTLTFLNLSGHSNYLTAEGFGLNIPAGATICAINVEVVRYATGISLFSNVKDNSVVLLNNGTPAGGNLASGANWAGSSETVNYTENGSGWTQAQVNSPNFGVAISAGVSGLLGVNLTANIDQIRISITYDMTTVLATALQDYSVIRAPDGNLLTWTASPALSGTRFTVQRSSDTHSWLDLSSMGGPDAVIAKREGPQTYTYEDPAPLAGNNFYRLRMDEPGGATSWSPIAGIRNNSTDITPGSFSGSGPGSASGTAGASAGISCYPNPFRDQLHLSSPRPIHRILLKDLQGRVILTKTTAFPDGVYSTQLALPDLLPGLYLLQADNETLRVIKQGK